MISKFLTEYVFDEDRIKDGVIDFKLDIAIRGDIALCAEKGNHKADKLLQLMNFFLDVPKEIYSYSVNVAKDYFKPEDVDKLSMHVVSQTPVYYLFYEKVLADLKALTVPMETKKSKFCRFIEDLCTIGLEVTQHLLEYTIDSDFTQLHDIARIYLTEVNNEIQRIIAEYGEQKERPQNEFYLVIKLINEQQIAKTPTLTEEKETPFDKFMKAVGEKINQKDNETKGNVNNTVSSFADYLRSKGVNVSVKTTTFDDMGNIIDYEEDDGEDDELNRKEVSEAHTSAINEMLDTLNADVSKLEEATKKQLEQAEMLRDVLSMALNVKKEEEQALDETDENSEVEQPVNHKFRVIKKNRFTGAIVDYSDYFESEYEAIKWKEFTEKRFPQLVEKFVFEIER